MAARRGRPHLSAILLAAAALAPACALGPVEDPGCHADTDCPPGFTCRAGACFRVTTSQSPPHDPADAGDGSPVD